MSAAATAPVLTGRSRRRVPRYPISVPVDITPLYPGAAGNIPGRALNICELGMATALAGELPTGALVRVEFPFPGLGTTLQSEAVVRHQAGLCCGVEFLGLSPDHQAIIRDTIRNSIPNSVPESPPAAPGGLASAIPVEEFASTETLSEPSRRHPFRRVVLVSAVVLAILGGLGWWHWSRAWEELESRLPARAVTSSAMGVRVPAEVMQQRLTHKVDVNAPHQAPGIVVLKVIVGRDGTVTSVRPIAGPDALTAAAMQAVTWWRYQPYLVNGKAVEVETTVAVQFSAEQ